MQENIIMLSSITYAYKAEAWLLKNSMKGYVYRIPKHLRTQGCGYGVRVRGDVNRAAALLKNAGFPVKEIL